MSLLLSLGVPPAFAGGTLFGVANHSNNSARRSSYDALLATAMLFAGAMILPGCEDPLLTPDEPRSQYDRFDAIRDQRAPSFVYDEFGRKRPNIRARLTSGE